MSFFYRFLPIYSQIFMHLFIWGHGVHVSIERMVGCGGQSGGSVFILCTVFNSEAL